MGKTLRYRHHWIFCLAALAAWFAVGYPLIEGYQSGRAIHSTPIPPALFVPYFAFGAALATSVILKLPAALHWTLLAVQVAAVVAMSEILQYANFSVLLVTVAWQVAMATSPARALVWVGAQTLAIVAAFASGLANFEFCFIFGLSVALQLFFVFTAHSLRTEAETAAALAKTNQELRSAQAMMAAAVRNAERLRISRELHDAWGHELTALGLQLEIASHVAETGAARNHVLRAQGLSRALLAKVRDVVSHLRDEERCDLHNALQTLAQSVPSPAVHVEVNSDVRMTADQAHAFMRCAQEAITNTIRHADAANLWLKVTSDGNGVRLVAQNDGTAPTAAPEGSGLKGMRERLETLGGRLAVRAGEGPAFTLDAWLPLRSPLAA